MRRPRAIERARWARDPLRPELKDDGAGRAPAAARLGVGEQLPAHPGGGVIAQRAPVARAGAHNQIEAAPGGLGLLDAPGEGAVGAVEEIGEGIAQGPTGGGNPAAGALGEAHFVGQALEARDLRGQDDLVPRPRSLRPGQEQIAARRPSEVRHRGQRSPHGRERTGGGTGVQAGAERRVHAGVLSGGFPVSSREEARALRGPAAARATVAPPPPPKATPGSAEIRAEAA